LFGRFYTERVGSLELAWFFDSRRAVSDPVNSSSRSIFFVALSSIVAPQDQKSDNYLYPRVLMSERCENFGGEVKQRSSVLQHMEQPILMAETLIMYF
jgi:hypothetical protein